MPKIQACLWCGRTDTQLVKARERHWYQVVCQVCGVSGPKAMSDEEAIAQWNEITNRAIKG